MKLYKTILVVFIVIYLFFQYSCSSNERMLKASGTPTVAPLLQQTFADYIEQNRRNIKKVISELRFSNEQQGLIECDNHSPYKGCYDADQIMEMRSPFQLPKKENKLCNNVEKGYGKGYLLIHGLTDSPYLLKNMAKSIHLKYPCALIRAVLLPGHGTVAGDFLTVKNDEWAATVEYGVETFNRLPAVKDLYIIGYSMGTSLAIKYMSDGKNTEKVKGLVLLSTAIKSSSFFANFAGFVNAIKLDWESQFSEQDAAKYESFSFNAGAEFTDLIGDIKDDYKLDIPVLMAVSADDNTTDSLEARDFFCNNNAQLSKSALIWYESSFSNAIKEKNDGCHNIATVKIDATEKIYQGVKYKVKSLAHTALTISPEDEHYGVKGKYRQCKQYQENPDDFKVCYDDTKTDVYGENLNERYWRRGTFNPYYEDLIDTIICFTTNSCEINTMLDFNTN